MPPSGEGRRPPKENAASENIKLDWTGMHAWLLRSIRDLPPACRDLVLPPTYKTSLCSGWEASAPGAAGGHLLPR